MCFNLSSLSNQIMFSPLLFLYTYRQDHQTKDKQRIILAPVVDKYRFTKVLQYPVSSSKLYVMLPTFMFGTLEVFNVIIKTLCIAFISLCSYTQQQLYYSLCFIIDDVLEDFCCFKIDDVLIFLCYF